MRIGILTGGGDCPGLNAVIRAVAKSLILQCDAEVVGIEQGFLGLMERRSRPLNFRSVSGILDEGGTILGTHNKANPFAYFGANGADVSAQAVDYYHELGLDALVAIGGDGTMSICHRLSALGMKIVGVPKTIDNDLMYCERTFGFDTAVAIATEAMDRIQSTAKSHRRVMIVETMGRYSGWIALESGLAAAADIILLPEFPYDLEEVARVCQRRAERQGFTVIAMAEGAHARGESMTVAQTVADSPDPVRLGGVSHVLARQLAPHVSSEIRATVLGHMQRGGSPTPFDRLLSTRFGCYAASMVASGNFGAMVALQDNHLVSVPLDMIADQNRTVPESSFLVTCALQMGISLGVGEMRAQMHLKGAKVKAD